MHNSRRKKQYYNMKTVLVCYNSFYFEEARVKYNHLVSSLKHLVPVIEVFSVSLFSRVKLTFNPFFPMHPFFTPENIRKPYVFRA